MIKGGVDNSKSPGSPRNISPRSYKLRRRFTTNSNTPGLARNLSENAMNEKEFHLLTGYKQVERLKQIGKGGCGITVWKARIDGWLCCMKELERKDVTKKEEDHFKKEIVNYSSIPQDNKHLCRFLGWQQTETHIQMFLTL